MSFNIADNLSDLNVRYVQLRAINSSASGQFQFSKGLPLLRFEINDSIAPLMLQGAHLRLTGKMTAGKSGGGNFQQAEPLESNYINRFAGVHGCIDNIVISSKRLNSNLERVQNYNRLVPSIVSTIHGREDIAGDLFHQSGSISNNWISRNALIARDGNDKGRDFSIPLYLGTLHSGSDINLSRTSGLSGLTIDILLKSDANVVWGSDSNSDSATYNLSDIALTVPLMEVSGETQERIEKAPDTFSFNTWSSVLTTINSQVSVVSLNPGLSRVTSVLFNAVNSQELGNQNFDPGRLGNLGQLERLRYTQNGVLFPLQYNLDTTDRQNASAAQGGKVSETVKCRAGNVRNVLESVITSSYFKARHTSMAFNEFNSSVVNVDQTAGKNGDNVQTVEQFGLIYDMFGSGSNFSTSTWSVELTVPEIDGNAATSQSLFVYFLNKNDVEFSQNGIDIIR